MSDSTPPRLDRRRLLGGVAVLGVAAPVLAACGSGDASSAAPAAPQDSSDGSGGSSKPSGAPAGNAGQLVATADVPVGGGVVLGSQSVVVTQPSDGEFKCFSAICTHQGCPVGGVADNVITCPCHGSQFSAEDGSVVTGPATAPLPAVNVQVKGDSVVRA